MLKFCSCRACRYGRHLGKRNKRRAHVTHRKMRHQTKMALAKGQEPPKTMSVDYTD